jgi:hypothetical protein
LSSLVISNRLGFENRSGSRVGLKWVWLDSSSVLPQTTRK